MVTFIMCVFYAIITVLNAIMLFVSVAESEYIFHKRYPELEIPKKHWAHNLNVNIRTIAWVGVPCIHIFTLYSLLFEHQHLIENAIHRQYLECMEIKRKETSGECSED